MGSTTALIVRSQEKYEAQLVFGKKGNLPPTAVKGANEIRKVLKSLQ